MKLFLGILALLLSPSVEMTRAGFNSILGTEITSLNWLSERFEERPSIHTTRSTVWESDKTIITVTTVENEPRQLTRTFTKTATEIFEAPAKGHHGPPHLKERKTETNEVLYRIRSSL